MDTLEERLLRELANGPMLPNDVQKLPSYWELQGEIHAAFDRLVAQGRVRLDRVLDMPMYDLEPNVGTAHTQEVGHG